MNRNKVLIISISVILVSITLIALLYRNAHPLGGIETSLSPSEVKAKSTAFLNKLGISHERLNWDVKFLSNNDLLRSTQKQYGIKKSNDLFRSGVPGYYWEITWKDDASIVINNSSENPEDMRQGTVTIKYDVNGNLLEYFRNISDSVKTNDVLTREEAEKVAVNFISEYVNAKEITPDTVNRGVTDTLRSISFTLGSGNMNYKDEKKIQQGKRTDYVFYYSGKDSLLPDESIQVSVTVAGRQVSGYKSEVILKGNRVPDTPVFDIVKNIVFYVVIFIIIVIIGFRRIRAFEIGFRTAIIMGIITAFCFALEIYLSIGSDMGWEILIPLILGPLFYGGGILLIWGVSETVTRETWNDKFISLDLLTKGYFMHSQVGSSILRGVAAGSFITAFSLLFILLIDYALPLGFIIDENTFLSFYSSPDAALSIINHFIYSSIFVTAVFFLFLASALKRRVNKILLFIISAGLWGLVNAKNIDPLFTAIILEVMVGLILIWVFYNFNILTVMIALSTSSIMLSAPSLFLQTNSEFVNSGYFLASGFLIVLALAVISLFTKDSIQDFQNIAPAFVKNITERERMQRELEIARDVQMSFLPKISPDFTGLDIAGKCLPALEVGGDYYDFVKPGGIIVGDVSGKGTQAAFYMTLTKGFLKAVSKLSASPSEVLSQMNELFYENVERGTFISMIYGVFDTAKRTLTLARAGHNPVIAKSSGKGKVEMINPTGLALGLEKGVIFRKTIEEVEILTNSGEVYVFYTDGFTEAMNKEREEYGEVRLMQCIETYSDCTAEIILEKVFTDVKDFIGKAIQHDDMTIVVVKVK